ncbi:hypothetical protein [Roseateles sp. PN1]|uniref:hypothetical protein n=1 Tax=Roseateles sp. PN1 TaxID=3137372 RepID=UPI0031396846
MAKGTKAGIGEIPAPIPLKERLFKKLNSQGQPLSKAELEQASKTRPKPLPKSENG